MWDVFLFFRCSDSLGALEYEAFGSEAEGGCCGYGYEGVFSCVYTDSLNFQEFMVVGQL